MAEPRRSQDFFAQFPKLVERVRKLEIGASARRSSSGGGAAATPYVWHSTLSSSTSVPADNSYVDFATNDQLPADEWGDYDPDDGGVRIPEDGWYGITSNLYLSSSGGAAGDRYVSMSVTATGISARTLGADLHREELTGGVVYLLTVAWFGELEEGENIGVTSDGSSGLSLMTADKSHLGIFRVV